MRYLYLSVLYVFIILESIHGLSLWLRNSTIKQVQSNVIPLNDELLNISSVWPSEKKWSEKPTKSPFDNDSVLWNSVECGIKNGQQDDEERIVGGQNADPGEWPWMVAMLNRGNLFCGGSLINKIHVLTAAHCVSHMGPEQVSRLRIRLGDYNIKKEDDIEHVEKRVIKIVKHSKFDPRKLINDIAILTLDSPVTYSSNIRPVCLPLSRSLYSDRVATVIGWAGLTSEMLQEVNIPIWSNKECEKKYKSIISGGFSESFLCAGKSSKDSCRGDSGGPLMVNDGKWFQIGIVSWGIGCGKEHFPGVYTRITEFVSWINKNVHT